MDDGLIQFLVIAVFIIISMMDGAARKRRKQAQSLEGVPGPGEFSEEADAPDQEAESSEGLVPEDLWQEIAALARGEVPEQGEGTPAMEAEAPARRSMTLFDRTDDLSPTETPSVDLQGGYLHPDQAAAHEEHAHETHAEVRPAEELPHEFVPHPPKQPSQPRKELRHAQKPRSLLSGLRSGNKKSLREAIVLAEVLSPPVTLRDSGWKPQF